MYLEFTVYNLNFCKSTLISNEM